MSRLGISRVTDITGLDRFGIPVFASIRPDAAAGSLCVNAGKGLRADEARVGAVMEAIEYAMAEYGASDIALIGGTALDVLDGRRDPEAVLRFCPILGRSISLDDQLICAEAEEVFSGERVRVPAELLFLPTPRNIIQKRWFGSSSNGLASGNTVEEATLHGLLEVIERDISTFHSFFDQSSLVDPLTYPPDAATLRDRIRDAGMAIFVRFQENVFGLPWFTATLVDPEYLNPYYVNGGCGCHLNPSIAIVRAITEAVQSRLSFIHGGRDDLTARYSRFEGWNESDKHNFVARLISRASRPDPAISFGEVPEPAIDASDFASALETLRRALEHAGMSCVLRVRYTAWDADLQVVRILVPGLEHFTETNRRIGARLRDFVQGLPDAES
jgi:ribosomal protein S12 methylthiotransferase accessory factor